MMDGGGSVARWSLESDQTKAMRGLNNDLHSFQARAQGDDPEAHAGGAGDPGTYRPLLTQTALNLHMQEEFRAMQANNSAALEDVLHNAIIKLGADDDYTQLFWVPSKVLLLR